MLVHLGSHTFNRTHPPFMLPAAMLVTALIVLAIAIALYIAVAAQGAAMPDPSLLGGIYTFSTQQTSTLFR